MKRTLTVLVPLAVLLGGCGGDQEELRGWMKEQSQDMRGHIAPLPQIKPYEPVAYDAAGLVDPFRPTKIQPDQKRGGGLQPDFDRPREPLEAYPLETLKFVGSMTRNKQTYALVVADGALYQVRPGNYMGQNFGVITSISETEIALRELVQDPTGEWTERTSTLQLQEKEGR